MQTPAQIVTMLTTNLNDPRMHSACLFLQDLIERKNPEPGVQNYRFKDIATSSYIETVEDFIAALDPAFLSQSYPYSGERLSGDRVTGFDLTPTNLVLELSPDSAEDNRFNAGPVYQAWVCFYMAYMNDMDPVVPVKISATRVVVASPL